MDIFICILAAIAAVMLLRGICILNDKRLEIGALVGVYWIIPGICIGLITAILWCIAHLSMHTV